MSNIWGIYKVRIPVENLNVKNLNNNFNEEQKMFYDEVVKNS